MSNKFTFSVKHLKTFFVLFTFLGLSLCYTQAQTQDEGVVINGIKWATRNLAAHGKFVEKPEDHGALFQWGRKGDGHEQRTSSNYSGVVSGSQNFDENGQIINTHIAYGKFITHNGLSPYDWRSPQNDNFWNSGNETIPVKTANDPCPNGWRMPTKTEFTTLGNGEWTNTPANGLRFGSGTEILFLPAAGFHRGSNGSLDYVGSNGHYWSSTPNNKTAYRLLFWSNHVSIDGGPDRANGLSIRCVCDATVVITEIETEKILLYPNPTTGELRIECGELRIENVDIFDVFGRKLLSHFQNTTIDISHLPVGVYFVKLYTESGEVIKKVLKE